MLVRFSTLLVVLAAALVPAAPALAAHAVVRCESIDYQDNYCSAQTHRGVRMSRQFSESECVIGQTWGYDRDGIWVTQGCGAEFEIGAHGQGYGYGYGYNSGGYVHCESHNYNREYCSVDTGGGVRLVNQTSHSACVEGRTWGFDHGGIWVFQGCAGEFQVGVGGHGGDQYEDGHSSGSYSGGYSSGAHSDDAYSAGGGHPNGGYGGTGHGNRETLRCESIDGVRNFCDARHNRRIRLLRQLSSSDCIEGRSWNATDRGVFVEHGCRADFEVTY